MKIDERNKKLIAMSYDKTAESTFVMILGKALVDADRNPSGQSLVSRVQSDLAAGILHARNSETIPAEQQDRLEILERLLTVTIARHLGLGLDESQTRH